MKERLIRRLLQRILHGGEVAYCLLVMSVVLIVILIIGWPDDWSLD